MRIRVPRQHKTPVSWVALVAVVVVTGPAWTFFLLLVWGLLPDQPALGLVGGAAVLLHLGSVVSSGSDSLAPRLRRTLLIVAALGAIIVWLSIGAVLGSAAISAWALTFAAAPIILRPREVAQDAPMPSLPDAA